MSRASAKSALLTASLAAALPAVGDGGAPSEVRLLPAGVFRSGDGSGRPENLPGWTLDEPQARRLIAAAAARASDYVIDYEHQTLHAATNGKPAPAAGWFKNLEFRPGDGLYAVGVRWTAEAAAMIAAGAYRYLSPVFGYDKTTGAVDALAHAALVNYPGLDGLTDLASLSASLFPPPEKEPPMKLLLVALGLAATATEDEGLAALAALKATQNTELAALKAQVSAAPDPAKYVEVAVLQAVSAEAAATKSELATLKAAQQASEVDAVVKAALAAGKLIPATESWARDLGKINLASLKSFLDNAAPTVTPGGTQSGGKAPAGQGGALSAEELAVCKATGVKPEDFVAMKPAT